jgi:uncharacterized OB-fold protein
METAPANTWRKQDATYNMTGSRCERCKTVYFPPRVICRNCGREGKIVVHKLSGEGTVYTYTVVRTPPQAFRDDAPYTIAVIKTAEGPIVEGHIVDNGKKVEIGAKVRRVLRRMHVDGEEGLIHYHFKFELV